MGLPAFLKPSEPSGASDEAVPPLGPEVDVACSDLWDQARTAWAAHPPEGSTEEDGADEDGAEGQGSDGEGRGGKGGGDKAGGDDKAGMEGKCGEGKCGEEKK